MKTIILDKKYFQLLCCLIVLLCPEVVKGESNNGAQVDIGQTAQTIIDVFAEKEKFTQAYCDSLQQQWWSLIRKCKTPESFSEQFTCDDSNPSDSTIYIDLQMQKWILFLTCYSDVFCNQGIGSTIYLSLRTIYTSWDELDITPLNYTQCIAALTWYDINREYVDPILFFHLWGNLGAFSTDPTQNWFNYNKNPRYFLADIKEINNLNSNELSPEYRDLAKTRALEILSMIQQKKTLCRDKAISILPYFHIWQVREYTRDVATYQGWRLTNVETEY